MQKTAKLWWERPQPARPRPGCRNAARTATGTGLHRVADGPHADSVQPRAADQAATDDPAVQRVIQSGAMRDQLQVRPGASELLGHRPQPRSSPVQLQEACVSAGPQ